MGKPAITSREFWPVIQLLFPEIAEFSVTSFKITTNVDDVVRIEMEYMPHGIGEGFINKLENETSVIKTYTLVEDE